MSTLDLSAIAERAVPDPLVPLFIQVMEAQRSNPDFISLAIGAPDSALLPADMSLELYKDALATYGPGVLNYSKPEGMPPFAQTFLGRLNEQGVAYDPAAQDCLITSGGMEAISMASEMLLDPGDVVVVESPAFAGALGVFQLWGAKIVHVACDKEGMQPEALQEAIAEHHPKLALLMPDSQNPSGATASLARRQALAAVLRESRLMAIEDGAYSRLRYSDDALPPLQSFAPEQVIYTTSMSKYLFPAARLGALIAPKAIVTPAAAAKSAYNMQASGLTQAMAERYLSPDRQYLDAYLPKLLKAYAERRDAMDKALHKHLDQLSGFRWEVPEGGMFMWLQGPESVDFTQLSSTAIQNGVAFVPGSAFYADGTRGHHDARLNFASTPAEKIDEAIRRLAQTITEDHR